jgi:hypothetical protein
MAGKHTPRDTGNRGHMTHTPFRASVLPTVHLEQPGTSANADAYGRQAIPLQRTLTVFCWCYYREVPVAQRDVKAGLTGPCELLWCLETDRIKRNQYGPPGPTS